MKKAVVLLMLALILSITGKNLYAQTETPPDGTYFFNGTVIVQSYEMQMDDLLLVVIKAGDALEYFQDWNKNGIMEDEEWESMRGSDVSYLGSHAFTAKSIRGPLLLFFKDEIGKYMFRSSEEEVVVVFEMEPMQ